MARYRCAVCGSPNVQKNEGNNNFSYKKALVGTAVFGTIGAVAGINGKQNAEFYCPDCGQTLKHPMNDTTRDMIDFLLSMPGTLRKSNPELLQRYTYLNQEIEQKISQPVTTTYVPAIASDVTEAEFRTAAKLWYDAFADTNDPEHIYRKLNDAEFGDPSVKYLSLEQYKTALQSVRTITLGLSSYGYLAVDQISGVDNGLSRYYLKSAVIHYTLDLYGDNQTLQDLYSFSNNNPVLAAAYRAVIDTRRLKMGDDPTISAFANWRRNLGISGSYSTMEAIVCRGGMDSLTFSRNYHIIDGSLYKRASSPELQFCSSMHQEYEELEKLEKEIPEQEKRIEEDYQRKIISMMIEYDRRIFPIQSSITEIEERISKLRKKIFGKAKAAETIVTLEKQIKEKKEKVDTIHREKFSEKSRLENEKATCIEKTCAAQKKRLEELLELKEAFIQQAPEMICLIEGSNEELAVPENEPTVAQQAVNAVIGSYTDEIKKLKELLDVGALTQEEFDAKKKQLLGL